MQQIASQSIFILKYFQGGHDPGPRYEARGTQPLGTSPTKDKS